MNFLLKVLIFLFLCMLQTDCWCYSTVYDTSNRQNNCPPSSDDSDCTDFEEAVNCPQRVISSQALNPPFTENEVAEGILTSVMQYILDQCCDKKVEMETSDAENETQIFNHIKKNKSHIGFLVVNPAKTERYSGFRFVYLMPYTMVFLVKTRKLDSGKILLDAVKNSWPLLVITILMTAIAGQITWALDCHYNSREFPRSFIKGSWEGFWWSFVSMTTVGYGDKTPKSFGARLFAVFWIFTGIVGMAIFTANITSALTQYSINNDWETQLLNKKVAVLRNNSIEFQTAKQQGANPEAYSGVNQLMKAAKSREADGILMNDLVAAFYMKQLNETSFYVAYRLQAQDLTIVERKRNTTSWLRDLKTCYEEKLDYDHGISQSFIEFEAKYPDPTTLLRKKSKGETLNIFENTSLGLWSTLIYILAGLFAGIIVLGLIADSFFKRLKFINQTCSISKEPKLVLDAIPKAVGENLLRIGQDQVTSQSDMKEMRNELRETQKMLSQLQSILEKLDIVKRQ